MLLCGDGGYLLPPSRSPPLLAIIRSRTDRKRALQTEGHRRKQKIGKMKNEGEQVERVGCRLV